MERLSLGDALFVYAADARDAYALASVTILRPATPGDDHVARFREHVASRLDLAPSPSAAGRARASFDGGAAGIEVKK